MPRLLTSAEVAAQVAGLTGWQVVGNAIERTVELVDFAAALDLVDRVGQEAEEMDHHPDIDIRMRTVRLAVHTHSAGGLTQLDIELAHRIDALLG